MPIFTIIWKILQQLGISLGVLSDCEELVGLLTGDDVVG